MVHIMCNVSIRKEKWDEVKKQTDPYQYVNVLSSSMWDDYDLMNRAMIIKKAKDRLPNRSPRKPQTPKKMAALTGSYVEFLKTQFKQKENYS